MADLEEAITSNVRDALNGDSEACKKLNLILQLPFNSILNLYGTTTEDHYALNVMAYLKVRSPIDPADRAAAKKYLTSAKNPLRAEFSQLVLEKRRVI